MIFGAMAGAAAGMYLYYEVKEAIESVKRYKEAKVQTELKLLELEEAKEELKKLRNENNSLRVQKWSAEVDADFYKQLCKQADLLIDPNASLEDFSRQLENPNSVFDFDA